MSDVSSIFRHEPGSTAAQAAAASVATPADTDATPADPRTRALALGAGTAAALAGGLLWALVVIATRYDVGILAWVVGAATGVAIVRVAGGPVGVLERVVAAALGAGGILVGKYLIFVHEVRVTLHQLYPTEQFSIGYLDTQQMSIFIHNFGHVVKPIYALWIGLAIIAALRTTAGRRVVPRRSS